MNAIDVKCPICEKINKSLDLVETDGWMECEHCGSTVQLMKYVRSHTIPICQMKNAKLFVPLTKK